MVKKKTSLKVALITSLTKVYTYCMGIMLKSIVMCRPKDKLLHMRLTTDKSDIQYRIYLY